MSRPVDPALAARFNRALHTAELDTGSFEWETRTSFVVNVNGVPVRGRLAIVSEDGLRDALATVLRDYCAGVAAGALPEAA